MGHRAMVRRFNQLEERVRAFAMALPSERELYRFIRRYGTRDPLKVACLWWPVVGPNMKKKGYGDGPYTDEQILEYMQALKSGPIPRPTINVPRAWGDPGADVLPPELEELFRGMDPLANRDGAALLHPDGLPDTAGESENHLRVIQESDASTDWDYDETERLEEIHRFRGDPGLRIVCDNADENSSAGPVEEEWATRFPDPKAEAVRFKIFHGETVVREVVLVCVDGGRARIPMPRKVEGSLVVDPFEYQVAAIVSLGGALKEYMNRAGLSIPAISTPGSGSVSSTSEGQGLASGQTGSHRNDKAPASDRRFRRVDHPWICPRTRRRRGEDELHEELNSRNAVESPV
ncbi:MAG: hypothetical protein O7H41_16465 [Planctomycetota bacterium]|nr:hypothetical protein [Planctomycetota bacterium]